MRRKFPGEWIGGELLAQRVSRMLCAHTAPREEKRCSGVNPSMSFFPLPAKERSSASARGSRRPGRRWFSEGQLAVHFHSGQRLVAVELPPRLSSRAAWNRRHPQGPPVREVALGVIVAARSSKPCVIHMADDRADAAVVDCVGRARNRRTRLRIPAGKLMLLAVIEVGVHRGRRHPHSALSTGGRAWRGGASPRIRSPRAHWRDRAPGRIATLE